MGAGRDLDGQFEEAGRSDKVDLGGCTVGTPGRMWSSLRSWELKGRTEARERKR